MHDRPSAMMQLFINGLDLAELRREPKPEVHATPEERKDMGRWLRDRLKRHAGSGTIVIDVVKRKARR